MSMFHYYNFPHCEAFIFDEFLVTQIREGVTIRPEHNQDLRDIIDLHFSNKNVVYISNRYFSYGVDPLTYLGTSKIHNLLAIVIVAHDDIKKSNAELESIFYKKEFAIFPTLSEAMGWAHKVIQNDKKNTSI
ncbi:hypothetical protein Aeqsu_2594 [Aequorivita sublithincola DSM 14238]|uniref:STAS/SEC14 domain-containing protein n=1 Tax=Aequorivita sublithincola (strain DSM 14238 / LMG 21431 / ACAM 643 / 9-3) TaxID=746697 RepID=I3YYI0_AEQSU|nr:hypothetical protein [Aequorivita sublithincola]AFL82048.1 hypothetical protein Aeqsu_2594 [Aequorivita sublithincola DSM 14238]